MQIILTDTQYTFDASAKTITLIAPYDALNVGQIISILDVVTADVLYASEYQRSLPITIAGAVITHAHGNGGQSDTDSLQIIVDIGGDTANPLNVSVTSGDTPFDDESITVAAASVGLTALTYLDATRAEMTLEDGQIRMWLVSTPTATVGAPVNIGDIVTLSSADEIAGFKAIRTGASSGVLRVTYYH